MHSGVVPRRSPLYTEIDEGSSGHFDQPVVLQWWKFQAILGIMLCYITGSQCSSCSVSILDLLWRVRADPGLVSLVVLLFVLVRNMIVVLGQC